MTDGSFETRAEHTFRTQRAAGESFAFTVTSDSHGRAGTNVANTMTNILSEQPDFDVDLGDTFMIDNTASQSAVNNAYLSYRDPSYFDKIASSIPLFLSSGNHENEEGWNLDDTPFSIALASVKARKLYYPTPISDGFYSGNTDPLAAIDAGTYGDQLREDYYAWTWGDALFVVIDPFQYTMYLPYTPIAGEGSEPVTGDQWSWTLGQQQYDWLTETLENSDARYKFVFSHQMVGGVPEQSVSGGAGYVRGGAEAAGYFEWGGKNANGTEGFAAHRLLWDKTIQQLFVENGVSAYFHGHDHQFVYETRDGVVYQEVPSAGNMANGFGGIYSEGDHGDYQTIKQISTSSTGHLRIAVGSDQATVDYVSSNSSSGAISYTYTIEPTEVSDDPTIDVAGSLSAFSSQPGTPSSQQSYTVSGSNLTDDILITAPTDFEISTTSGSGWTSAVTLPETGGTVAATPIYVRFNRATQGTSSGNIVHSSAGADTKDLAVTGTAALPIGAITVSAPDAPASVARGGELAVSWAPDAAVPAPAQFGVWLVKGGVWSLAAVYDADGSADYTRQVPVNVPVDTGYQVYVYYRASSGDAWSVGGLAAGTLDVTGGVFSSIAVSAPSTTASVARGGELAVSWAPDAPVAAPAQFGVWLVKGGVWSLAAVYDADNGASYTRQVPVNVPVGDGYQVYVYYRADSGAAWSVGGLAAGTLDVTGGVFSSIAVTAPSTTASVARGGDLTVSWAPDAPVAAPAQFGVWLVKGGVWSLAAVYDADNSASYTRQVPVSVPVGDGYQVYVYYRASSGDAWSVGGLAAGTLDVTAGSVFESIDVTAPTGSTIRVQGGNLAVSWAPDAPVAAPAQFGVWLVRAGIWSLAAVYDADGSAAYVRSVALNVPVADGYQVYVYYRAGDGDPWSIYGLAPGTVNVIAP